MPDGAGRRARLARLESGQWLALTAGALVLAALVGLVICLLALHNLSVARHTVVDRIDPARLSSSTLLTALVDEETGVRGYALSAQPRFLDPYQEGSAAAGRASAELLAVARTGALGASLTADLRRFQHEIASWRADVALPALDRTRRTGRPALDLRSDAALQRRFERVRTAFSAFDAHLAVRREAERARLRHAANAATIAVLFAVGLLLAAALAASVTLRRAVARPLARLARDARLVARGDLDHPVTIQGPRDVIALSLDVESMRRRIIDELDAVTEARGRLEEQARDLQRSNSELEQFAYVASHDLQEPLRKVASFCGMLQQRYHGQLDERADQYIDFAVDGAKRMQVLINDLLAFSRVGRSASGRELVEMDEIVAEALGNLGTAIEEADATIDVAGSLPPVLGDRSLLVALVQNLVGNAVKFRGDAPPRVRIAVTRDDAPPDDGHGPGGDAYIFSIDDNGIGIEPRYADRIFVIFQRLHPKEEYSGTGIGLAMCRKIVEWHGGRIWLETRGPLGGASFRFTLPVPDEAAARMVPAPTGEQEPA